jgi:predicted CoA-substrate-specific enzyme activase
MKYCLTDLFGSRFQNYACERAVVGLDLGSRSAKGMLLARDHAYAALTATGLYMQETAEELIANLLGQACLNRKEIGFITCTGYGRVALSFEAIPFNVVTEISCHAMGAHALYPQTRTVIDIGGQDSKAIKINPSNGAVADFVMNDKCAAGTGQFLEKTALLLGITLDKLGTCALSASNPASISSQCVVFAESEMISLRAKGARTGDSEIVANIAAGVHYSAARRINNHLGRLRGEPEFIFTGGVANNPGMRKALEELTGHAFLKTNFDMVYAGALGATVYARQKQMRG